MSSFTLSIQARDRITPQLSRVIAGLDDRTGLNAKIATRAENLTSAYLRRIAGSRHATAERLGAKPTGHLERAADAVSSSWSADAATVSIGSPGIGRAFRPLEIRPRNSKYLTLPRHADSYGKRAREMDDLQLIRTPAGALLLIRPLPGTDVFETMYKLVTSVKIKQDRTLLPSDEAFLGAMELGARDFIDDLKEQGGDDA